MTQKNQNELTPLLQLLQDQAKLLGSMQVFLLSQQTMLKTLLNTSKAVTTEYQNHVTRIVNMRKKLEPFTPATENENDNETVNQPDNGSVE